MARDTWFETVAFAQERAKKRLPKSVYAALLAASEKGITVADNVEAFSELGFAPHVIGVSLRRCKEESGRRFPRRPASLKEGAHVRVEEGIACAAVAGGD